MSKSGVTWNFTYDADGLRSKRTDGSNTYLYYYDGGLLRCMEYNGVKMFFTYDAQGMPVSMTYNGVTYYYALNLQGDVMAILNASSAAVVNYNYNAWGELLSTTGSLANTIGLYNPLRYRGYVYDRETGLYYLQSRYYNPEICRFISADNQLSTDSPIDVNLFAYCGNNPVNRVDPTGEAWWHWALGAAVVAACAVATVVTCGGFAAAATAVGLVSSGMAASTTAATVATAAFIGSATVYGTAVIAAATTSESVQEFMDHANWGTVAATAVGAFLYGYDGYSMSSKQSAPATGRGMNNPRVRAAVQKGQEMHKQMDYGPGVLKEQTIAPGCRVDGIDHTNHIIYELKPNNPQAIARGMRQLNRYTAAASQVYGGVWTGVLKLYD